MEITYREIFGAITMLQSFFIYIPYIYATAKGRLRPHPITWVIACLSGGSSGLILLFNGAGAGAWGNLLTVFFTLILSFVAFFNYRKSSKISRHDVVLLCLAILALVLWLLSRNLAVISVVLLSASSVFGIFPTLMKTWKNPRSESLYTWIMFLFQAIFGLIATANFDFVNTFRRFVMVAINSTVIAAMFYCRHKIKPSDGPILINS
ncbi:hypothetical protein FWH58_03580 [Candidatus Saccharibacteria bacterium]|nr:hypothetical protein [Candidatus Saccharibacteria bacterium]